MWRSGNINEVLSNEKSLCCYTKLLIAQAEDKTLRDDDGCHGEADFNLLK